MALDVDVKRILQLQEGVKVNFQNPWITNLLLDPSLLRRTSLPYKVGYFCEATIKPGLFGYRGSVIIASDKELKKRKSYWLMCIEGIH